MSLLRRRGKSFNSCNTKNREILRLFFLRKSQGNEVTSQVNLEEIRECRDVSMCRIVSKKHSNRIVNEWIDLAITPRAGNNPETLFELYNSNQDGLLMNGEFHLAEKQATIANAMIAECRNNVLLFQIQRLSNKPGKSSEELISISTAKKVRIVDKKCSSDHMIFPFNFKFEVLT